MSETAGRRAEPTRDAAERRWRLTGARVDGSDIGRRGTVTTIALRSALVTLLGIGGSIAVVFLSVGLWLSGMGFAAPGSSSGKPLTAWFVALGVVLVILPPFLGGAIWGGGIARIFGSRVRPSARTGALAFGGMIILTAAPTDLTQLWLDDLPTWMPWDVHGYFTMVFMVEVLVVAAVATWRLVKRMGAPDAVSVGAWTGVGAALGFLVGSLVAAAVGFRIYPWVRLSMVWAFLIALPVCTLGAGTALGVRLHRAETVERARELDSNPGSGAPGHGVGEWAVGEVKNSV